LLSANSFRFFCDIVIENLADTGKYSLVDFQGKRIYIKSSLAELVFERLLLNVNFEFIDSRIILHGDDQTISKATAENLVSRGITLKSVNWLGDQSFVKSLPIGIPTLERLNGIHEENFQEYLAHYEILRKNNKDRDIYLYSNFDITTNIPYRKQALLASLRVDNTYAPTGRIGLIENLEILSRSKFVLSPPGAGPDCFRTWEAIYLGAIPIVLRSHWPFSHLDLPVLIVDSFDNLGQKIAGFDNEEHVRNESWEDYFRVP
jgi:hypothetical protein